MAYPPEERRQALADSVVECEGNISKVAFELGYARWSITRMIGKLRLWPVVNNVRRAKNRKKK